MSIKKIENNFQQPKILWRDRRRRMGMPLSFTVYTVDNDRLYVKKGFFTTHVSELLLYRVLDIKSRRTLWQKIFGMGTITLYNADSSDGTLALVNVKNPEAVRRFLSQIVEQRRNEKGITGREIYGASGMAHSHDGPPPTFTDIDGDGIPDMVEPPDVDRN